MKSNYRKLGDFIEQTDERNVNLNIDNLLGVSIEKEFMPSIANTIGTDLSKYKIVHQDEFAYGPVTSRNGDKVSIAKLKDESCIISSSYTSFKIVGKDLLPDYLMLWFKRREFDRYARFKSHGSAREIFDWEQLCNIELPVPPIEDQHEIVSAYQALEQRIDILGQLNDKLAASIELIRDNCAHSGNDVLLGDCVSMQYGYTQSACEKDVGPKFLRITDITSSLLDWNDVPYCEISADLEEKYRLKPGDVVVARTGVSAGTARYFGNSIPRSVFASFLVRVQANNPIEQTFIGLTVASKRFYGFIQDNAGGSAQPQANPPLLGAYEFLMPDKPVLTQFNNTVNPIIALIEKNEKQASILKEVQNSILKGLALQH